MLNNFYQQPLYVRYIFTHLCTVNMTGKEASQVVTISTLHPLRRLSSLFIFETFYNHFFQKFQHLKCLHIGVQLLLHKIN